MTRPSLERENNGVLAPWHVVKARANALEAVVVFFGLPVLLTVVQFAVDPADWALPLSAPSIISSPEVFVRAFTSSYVHEDLGHLGRNILAYFLLMLALYPLTLLAEWRRHFAAASLGYLTVGAFVVSQMSLILPASVYQHGLGFSGINGAFLGFLPLVLFAAIDRSAYPTLHPFWSVVPVLWTMPVVFWYAPTLLPMLSRAPLLDLIFGFTLVALIFTYILHRVVGINTVVAGLVSSDVLVIGLGLGLIVFFGQFIAAGEANVVAHFFGYYVGFFAPFSFVVYTYVQRVTVQLNDQVAR